MKKVDVRRMAVLGVFAGTMVLQGCGDTCTSKAAQVAVASGNCSLAAGSQVTITVPVTASCGETSGACAVEVVGGQLELAPSFQECQSNSSCPAGGAGAGTVDCLVPADTAVAGPPMALVVVGDNGPFTVGQVQFTGGNQSCALTRSAAIGPAPVPTP